jgi:hypothetical protein
MVVVFLLKVKPTGLVGVYRLASIAATLRSM